MRLVESRYAARVDLNARQVMDAVIALANHRSDLADSDFCSVCAIERASRVVTRRDDRKDHRTEDRLEFLVERAVNENRLGGKRLSRALVCHAVARTAPKMRRGWLEPWQNAGPVSGES